MDPVTILSTVATVIKTAVDLGPSIIKGVEDATPFAEAIYDVVIKGDSVTEDDLANLKAQIAALSAQLQAPMSGETTTSGTASS